MSQKKLTTCTFQAKSSKNRIEYFRYVLTKLNKKQRKNYVDSQ